MKKFSVYLLAVFLFITCTNKKNIPDVSGIKADVRIQRFDEDFFDIDTHNIEKVIMPLGTKYPTLLPLFLQTIVGVNDTTGIKNFYRLYKPVFDSSQKIYRDFDPVHKQIAQAFKYVKYYFPEYKLPATVIPVVGPMNSRQDLAQMENGDYTPDFMGPDFIGISLQFYLGKNFSLYQHEYFITNVAPLYLSRRFAKEYIIADVMKVLTTDIFPDKSKSRPLIEQMIERGKQWWLLDKFLPEVADSIKTGYTQHQLDWCSESEGLIWSYLIKNEDLYSVNPVTLQTYIGEAPFTPVFSQELSPGNIGQWIGWQIVKKYANNNSGMHPRDVMQSAPKRILDEAKYKPK